MPWLRSRSCCSYCQQARWREGKRRKRSKQVKQVGQPSNEAGAYLGGGGSEAENFPVEATTIHFQDLLSAGKTTVFKILLIRSFAIAYWNHCGLFLLLPWNFIFGQAHYVPRRLQSPEFDVDHLVSCCSSF